MTAPRRFRVLALLLCLVVGACGGGSGGGSDDTGGTPPDDPPPIVYAGMGASDAVGVGATPNTRGYVYLLAGRMRALGHETTLVNTGISGAQIDELLDPQLDEAVGAQPGIVTIWTGSNDVIAGMDPDGFATQLDALLGALRARTQATIYIGNLVDLTSVPLFRLFPNANVTVARIDAFNQRIETAAATHECTVVRLSDIPFDDSMFFVDGFHPNNSGYEQMADAFWAAIEPNLN